jgi:hypothetical protein
LGLIPNVLIACLESGSFDDVHVGGEKFRQFVLEPELIDQRSAGEEVDEKIDVTGGGVVAAGKAPEDGDDCGPVLRLCGTCGP